VNTVYKGDSIYNNNIIVKFAMKIDYNCLYSFHMTLTCSKQINMGAVRNM